MTSNEMGRVLVSVLMPTFKQGAFIRRAIDSIYAQTITSWELVMINDRSPDEIGKIVDQYVDERVHYHVFQRNRGLGASLTFATAQARGQYIAYLPSDDFFYLDHLALLTDYLNDHLDIYLAYGGIRWGGLTRKRSMPTLLKSL